MARQTTALSELSVQPLLAVLGHPSAPVARAGLRVEIHTAGVIIALLFDPADLPEPGNAPIRSRVQP